MKGEQKKNETVDTHVEKSDVALREEEMLAFWSKHDIFNKSLEKDAPNGDFVFYDGPPFATGLPHYGHILAGTIKDAIPRFWTMNGYRVPRKWGWDCHGLPLENLIEKKLGLATKRDIEELGVKTFNEAARGAVMEYADDWRKIIPRMGRFVDMENDYKTMDPTYTESVWWVFSELHKKGLVYEGFKSMHLCPRCGTTLSNFEVNQGYKDIKDISVFVKLPLLDDEGKTTDTSLLVWTTTPWTLPGNMATAVHEEGDYVEVEDKYIPDVVTVPLNEGKNLEGSKVATERYVLSKVAFERYKGDFRNQKPKIVREFKGSKLVGKSYEPPFNYWQKQEFEGKENAWKIYHADYVELGDDHNADALAGGTGAVHLAPAYGEDDMNLAREHGVPIVHHVDESGHFKDFVTDFAGQLVKPKDDDDAGILHLDADIKITKALQEKGKLFKKENVKHSYPHCWRCDTPLLNYATTSWFVEVTKIKDELVAENNKIHWVPEHIGKSRFGKWLEGARDWAVSRQRYWGAPLPVWRNPNTKEYKVFGSLADLRKYVHNSENTFFLMRHGESESNANGISSTDINEKNSLTKKGVAQVKDAIVGLKEKNIDLIIASPYQRTKETASMIAKELGLSESKLLFDERIGEIQLGEFDKQPIELYHDFLDSGAQWNDGKPIDGESWNDVKKRMGEFLYDIDAKYEEKNILLIAHNSPLRMLGAVNGGLALSDSAFDHDEDGKRYGNAEVRELPFIPMPHNDNYELDYHRPYIDEVELFDEDGTKMERVPDVFDCWFESGSMPYGQHHYPFENLDEFDAEKGVGFPAQFIAESIDQTRGWFYSLIVIGTALFGKAPYKNVITNGLVLAEDGKKMSKSLQNYPDPMYIANTLGSDAMRFYLLSSPIMKGEDLNFSEKGVLELQRKNIGRLHNVLTMYKMYEDESIKARDNSENILDRWIIARLNELVKETTDGFRNYELDKATRPITEFIDDLSVWYLRRSRDRIKGDDSTNRENTLRTLRHVLKTLALTIAPSMPFYSEYLYQAVKEKEDAESVHLAAWPTAGNVDTNLLDEMQYTREVITQALEIRSKANIKVRQPLPKLKVENVPKEMWHLIKDEVNVKELVVSISVTPETQSVKISVPQPTVVLDTTITPELKAEGDSREFIRAIQSLRKKTGLEAQDNIILTVQTSPEGQALIDTYIDDIQKTVGSSKIVFADTEGEDIVAGTHTFVVAITKII